MEPGEFQRLLTHDEPIEVRIGSAINDLLGKRSIRFSECFFSKETDPIFMGGSLFTTFPLRKALKDKGTRADLISSFIPARGGEASLLPRETKFLGWPFALLRLSLVVLFAFIMGVLMDRVGDDPA